MTQLSNFLEQEVTKFKDISHILKKLESDGEVDTISKVFKDVFTNEFNFTMKELARIESEEKKKIDMREQCENNLSLFKANFHIIVNMIFEKSYSSIFEENKKKSVPVDDTTAGSINSVSIEETPNSRKKSKRAKSKARHSKSPKHGAKYLDLNTPKAKTKKKGQNSANRAPSPLSRIFGPSVVSMSSSTRNKDIANSYMRDKSFHAAPEKKSPMKKLPSSILNQTASTLNRSSSFVQSEFNYIHGCATFPRSPRRNELFEPKDCSPGPAAYKAERSSLRQSPSPTIDRANKKCWIDEHVAMNDSPGVGGLYPSHHFLSK